jgi:16S rRNA processing protein RimM
MPISRGWKPGTPRAGSGERCRGVLDFGGGDLLELRDEGRKPVVIPFTLSAVPTVDLEAGRILVDPLAAGLIDTGEDDGPEDDENGNGGEDGQGDGK